MVDDVDEIEIEDAFGTAVVPVVPPVEAYFQALRLYDGALLAQIARTLGIGDLPVGRAPLASSISELLARPRAAESRLALSPKDSRFLAGLLAIADRTSWTGHALAFTLACLGVDFSNAVGGLLEKGLLALSLPNGVTVRSLQVPAIPGPDGPVTLLAHPALIASARTVLPEGLIPPFSENVRSPREADGLEPIIRMAALWQRVSDAPLRQTQTGSIYKRDRERLEDDPVLAGPIADALEPLPDMPLLWLALAVGVGMIRGETGTERVVAAEPVYWSDNAYHLAQMVAQRWLSLTNWHEQGGLQRDGALYELSLPHARPAVLLWLATVPEDAWVATEDLAAFLRERLPHWDLPTFVNPAGAGPNGATTQPVAKGSVSARRAKPRSSTNPDPTIASTLDAMLLGPAYQFGLIRAAEEVPSGRKVVQLTPLGRYLLMLGPPPGPRPSYEHFLFVQPNFEAIAYRQGLNPGLVGQLSRFTHWTQVGAALAFRITPESVYRGLEGGMTTLGMLDLLGKHSARPLHSGLPESVRTWAGRRERVTYHSAATLIEFANNADLEKALTLWPLSEASPPLKISDRLLLVDGSGVIPFQRFRMAGARDYRRPPEACVEVEPDGISLSLDLARSDLLVDAELVRFADESAERLPSRSSTSAPRRRFSVSADSLTRGLEAGLTAQSLSQWFQRRTGADTPPAIRLLLAALASQISPLLTSRPLVLHTPSSELLDGLAQHPETCNLLGDRLGPTTVVIPDDALVAFRQALTRLGLRIAGIEKS